MIDISQESVDSMKKEARKFLKLELAKRDISYVKLAELMVAKGYKETPDTIRSKIHRGTFSFAFVLEIAETLETEVRLI